MKVVKGKQEKAQRVVIYGPEGIGKSTLGSQFPNPIFLDTEGSTSQLDVARMPKASSWSMLVSLLQEFQADRMGYNTLVIDTVDWAERMCAEQQCAQHGKESIEDFGYGKGYTVLAEQFGKFLNFLTDLSDTGTHIVLLAHSGIKKFEQPEEAGAYDRYELKMEKKTSPLVKEWADMVLFANYKTFVVEIDGKKKAQGGKRVFQTQHHTCWDAKNRHSLESELLMEYSAIAHCFPVIESPVEAPAKTDPAPATTTAKPPVVVGENEAAETLGNCLKFHEDDEIPGLEEASQEDERPVAEVDKTAFNTALYELMKAANVTAEEIQQIVALKGYYPAETPIDNYGEDFVKGVLVAAWDQVFKGIQELRKGN